jgi:hypothetical protein
MNYGSHSKLNSPARLAGVGGGVEGAVADGEIPKVRIILVTNANSAYDTIGDVVIQDSSFLLREFFC